MKKILKRLRIGLRVSIVFIAVLYFYGFYTISLGFPVTGVFLITLNTASLVLAIIALQMNRDLVDLIDYNENH